MNTEFNTVWLSFDTHNLTQSLSSQRVQLHHLNTNRILSCTSFVNSEQVLFQVEAKLLIKQNILGFRVSLDSLTGQPVDWWADSSEPWFMNAFTRPTLVLVFRVASVVFRLCYHPRQKDRWVRALRVQFHQSSTYLASEHTPHTWQHNSSRFQLPCWCGCTFRTQKAFEAEFGCRNESMSSHTYLFTERCPDVGAHVWSVLASVAQIGRLTSVIFLFEQLKFRQWKYDKITIDKFLGFIVVVL